MGYDLEMNSNIIVVDDSMFLGALKHLKDDGEITLEQYAESLRRAKNGV